jgi:hypothetical protein
MVGLKVCPAIIKNPRENASLQGQADTISRKDATTPLPMENNFLEKL